MYKYYTILLKRYSKAKHRAPAYLGALYYCYLSIGSYGFLVFVPKPEVMCKSVLPKA